MTSPAHRRYVEHLNGCWFATVGHWCDTCFRLCRDADAESHAPALLAARGEMVGGGVRA